MYSHVRKKSHLKHIHGIIEERERKYKIIKKENKTENKWLKNKSKEA